LMFSGNLTEAEFNVNGRAETGNWKSRRQVMAQNKKTAVFGIFSTMAAADFATDSLIRAGFTGADISALIPENLGSRQIGTEKNSKAPEGAATGAGSGAVVGGALGLLAGIGALAIPGIGPLIAAGPLMATLAGIGVGGAVGGFSGALIGMGIPEYEAKLYEGYIQKGAILLSTHCDTSEEIRRAKEVMKMTGAEDISSTGESSADSGAVRERGRGATGGAD
jgi:hypothetical protein